MDTNLGGASILGASRLTFLSEDFCGRQMPRNCPRWLMKLPESRLAKEKYGLRGHELASYEAFPSPLKPRLELQSLPKVAPLAVGSHLGREGLS